MGKTNPTLCPDHCHQHHHLIIIITVYHYGRNNSKHCWLSVKIRTTWELMPCWRKKNDTIWLFNSSPWYRWPIEIDGLPIKNEDFHGYVSHSQLVPLKPQNWISGPQPHLNRILGLPDSNKAICRVRPGHGGRWKLPRQMLATFIWALQFHVSGKLPQYHVEPTSKPKTGRWKEDVGQLVTKSPRMCARRIQTVDGRCIQSSFIVGTQKKRNLKDIIPALDACDFYQIITASCFDVQFFCFPLVMTVT